MSTVGRTPLRARETPARSAISTLLPDADMISVHAEMEKPGVVHFPAKCHSDVTSITNDRYHITHLPNGCHVEFTGEGKKQIGVTIGTINVVQHTRWRRGAHRDKPKGDESTLVITLKVKMQMINGRMHGVTTMYAKGGDRIIDAYLASIPSVRGADGDATDCIVIGITADFPRPPESRIIIVIKVEATSGTWVTPSSEQRNAISWITRVAPPITEDIIVPMDDA